MTSLHTGSLPKNIRRLVLGGIVAGAANWEAAHLETTQSPARTPKGGTKPATKSVRKATRPKWKPITSIGTRA